MAGRSTAGGCCATTTRPAWPGSATASPISPSASGSRRSSRRRCSRSSRAKGAASPSGGSRAARHRDGGRGYRAPRALFRRSASVLNEHLRPALWWERLWYPAQRQAAAMTLAQVPACISRRTVRLIQGLMAMSVLVPIIGIGLVVWQDRDAVLSAAERHVEQSVDILHEHTLKVFEIHDLVLDKIAMRADGLDWASIDGSPAIAEYMAGHVAHIRYVRSIRLIDGDAGVRVSSDPSHHIAGLNVEDREYFRAERDVAGTTFISKPYMGRLSHKPLFGVARRRSTEGGAFDGVIRISVPVEYFEHLFLSIEPDERHRIVLVRADGEVLASDPRPPGEVVRFPKSSLLMQAIAGGYHSHSWQVSPMDGREHLFSWRKLGQYPLYVAYAIDKEVALQPWYRHGRLYSAVGLGAALALFLVRWLALRYTRREQDLLQRVTQEADGPGRPEVSLQHVRKLRTTGHMTVR